MFSGGLNGLVSLNPPGRRSTLGNEIQTYESSERGDWESQAFIGERSVFLQF